MKSQVDGVDVLTLQAWEYELLKDVWPAADLDAELKRMLTWVWSHKVEQTYKRLQAEWVPKLMADPAVSSLPADKEAFFNVVKVHADYKDCDARIAAQ